MHFDIEYERADIFLWSFVLVSGDEITPVCLFQFIINPHSFGQTIENLFHLSFLVKVSKNSFNQESSLNVVERKKVYQGTDLNINKY